MATKQTPKHDFAPSWLKLDQDQKKKSLGLEQDNKGSSRNGRRDDLFNYNRYPPPGSDYNFHPLQRQRSFEHYDERGLSQAKYRHHSVDDDYYMSPPHGGYQGHYNHCRSQPSLMRDGKYQHPNSRQVPPSQMMNNLYPPYLDSYSEFYSESSYPRPTRQPPTGKRGYYEGSQGRGEGREQKLMDGSDNVSKKSSLDEEFPSLNGDADPPEKTRTHGAWEKPPIRKKHIVNSTKSDDVNGDHKGKRHEYKFKASLGAKSGMSPKILGSHNSSDSKDINSNAPLKAGQSDSHGKRATNAIDIQNGVKHANGGSKENGYNGTDHLSNGMDALSVSPDDHMPSPGSDHLLSSSLEAEQRLLRQMGWNEGDDEDYEITEDDLKEFNILSQQMKQKKSRMQLPTSATLWTPSHPAMYTPQALNDDGTSSISSESDLD